MGAINTGIFSEEELAQVVEKAVPRDSGRKRAIVMSLDEDDFEIAVEMKFKPKIGEWKAMAAFTRDWKGDKKVGAKVAWSF